MDAAGATDGASIQTIAESPARTPYADNPYSGRVRPTVASKVVGGGDGKRIDVPRLVRNLNRDDQWVGIMESCGVRPRWRYFLASTPSEAQRAPFSIDSAYCRVSWQ